MVPIKLMAYRLSLVPLDHERRTALQSKETMGMVRLEDLVPEEAGGPAATWYCRQLEIGSILYFPITPFDLPGDNLGFLLGQHQSDAGYHKNIAYRPAQDRITGGAYSRRADRERLHDIMRNYSRRVTHFMSALLSPYAQSWKLDYATFRPKEEEGRNLRLRARNDLLHVDSFPTRPTRGDRILRVFTNINPSRARRWITTDPFDVLIREFSGSELPWPKLRDGTVWRRLHRALARAASVLGFSFAVGSPYDDFMLRFHHFLKENQEFQANCSKERLEFAPYSTWMVFTDMVPHAVLSGQFALEQTYIVSRDSMVYPEKAPVNILEQLRAGDPAT